MVDREAGQCEAGGEYGGWKIQMPTTNMNRYICYNVKSLQGASTVRAPWSVSASLRLRVSAVKVDRGQLQTAWVSGVARIFHSKSGYFTGHFTSKPRGFRGLRKNPLFFFFGQDDGLQEPGIACGLRNPRAQRVGVCRDMPPRDRVARQPGCCSN